jgi:hypothetical protein
MRGRVTEVDGKILKLKTEGKSLRHIAAALGCPIPLS